MGTIFFLDVYFSRGTLPTKKRGGKGHYGNLAKAPSQQRLEDEQGSGTKGSVRTKKNTCWTIRRAPRPKTESNLCRLRLHAQKNTQ